MPASGSDSAAAAIFGDGSFYASNRTWIVAAGTAGQSRLFNDYSITITCPSASTSPGSARKEPREHITTTTSPLLLASPEDEGHHRHLIYLKAAFLKRAH